MASALRIYWWVTHGNRPPVGPVSTELLIQGIQTGKVPSDSFVCEVGGVVWRRLVAISTFAAALSEAKPRQPFDPESERFHVGSPPLPPSDATQTGAPDDSMEELASSPRNEVTVVDHLRSSHPPAREATRRRFDETPEQSTGDSVKFE